MDLTTLSPAEQRAVLAHASSAYGLHLCHPSHGEMQGFIPRALALDMALAMDALPPLVTVGNGGIPAYFTNYYEPKYIEVLTAPTKAAEIYGETKKGTWTDQTMIFAMVESVGETSSYGDRNTNGQVGVNLNWPQRQQYLYQTMQTWGDLESARAGVAQIDWAGRLNIAAATIMKQFENKVAFYGVQGLQLYGALNDPSLPTPITPNAKAAGGFTWLNNATYLEIVNDVNKLFAQLITQTNGLVDLDTPMGLVMSPTVSVGLTYVSQYNNGVSVRDTLQKTYPNLRIVTAPQFGTTSGQLLQLIVTELNGQKTVETAFSEKMRSHGIVRDVSHWKEKKSGGTWGTVYYNYFAIAQMIGV